MFDGKQTSALTVVNKMCAFTNDSVAKLQGDGDLGIADGGAHLATVLKALGVN